MQDLSPEEIDGFRQVGGGQKLFGEPAEDLLRGGIVLEPFAEGAKAVSLLDVFLAREGGAAHGNLQKNPGFGPQTTDYKRLPIGPRNSFWRVAGGGTNC